MLLDKDLTRNLVELGFVRIPVPEFREGCEVLIRPMTAPERIDYLTERARRAEDADDNDTDDLSSGLEEMANLVIRSVVDEAGNLVYEKDDGELVLSLNLKGLARITREVVKINGLDIEGLMGE